MVMELEALGKRTPAALAHIGLNGEPRWPFDYARLEMSYGGWLRRQRRITESRPHLRAARDTFEALGVQPWADKARAELRASGERVAEPIKALRQPLSCRSCTPRKWRRRDFPIVRSPTGCSCRIAQSARTSTACS